MSPTPAGRYTGIAGTGRSPGTNIPPRPTRPAASPSNIASGRHTPPMTTNVVHRRPRPSSSSGGSSSSGSQQTNPAPSSGGGGSRSKLFGSARKGGSRLVHGTSPASGRRTRYSLLIAVEYLACMAMIGLSAAGVGKDQTPPAFTDPAIALVRLSAVSVLFFSLALLSAGRQLGRIAAAFGGLVTLGVAFNAIGEWQDLAGLFGGTPSTSSPSSPSGPELA